MSNTVTSKSGDEVAAEEDQSGFLWCLPYQKWLHEPEAALLCRDINIKDLPVEILQIILRHLAWTDYYALYYLGETSMFFSKLCDDFIVNNPKEEFFCKDRDSDDDYPYQIDFNRSYTESRKTYYTMSIDDEGHVYRHYEGQPHYVYYDDY